MEEYKTELNEAETILISKIVKIPCDKWTFSMNGLANHFYLIIDEFRYVLYVSGGALTSLQIASEKISDKNLSINPTDDLDAYCDKLFDDLQRKQDAVTANLMVEIDTSLNKIIESV
jgi:hypothetical protein